MKTPSLNAGMSRRRFLATTGTAAVAFPTIIPSSVLGRNGETTPSNRITMGVVGWGMQGPGNTGAFLGLPDCQVVAACDLDSRALRAAVTRINGKYGNLDCKGYHDYQDLMARKDIDTVMLAVPDNWHALVATEAARNKKDIYGEKPLARTIAEQQAIVKAVHHHHRVWQTGSWQRSERHFHYAAEIVRNGLIGKVTRVEVGLPSGHTDFGGTAPALLKKLGRTDNDREYLAKVTRGSADWKLAVTPPPYELDYETWIGPAHMEPYIEARVHKNWRWNYNIGGGQLLDWIGHHCDIAHWGLGNDDTIGPLEVEGTGDFPPPDTIWNTCTKYRITATYPNEITMIIAGGQPDIRGGTKWIGTDGWVWVDRGNAFAASNKAWEESRTLPEEHRKVKLHFNKAGHWQDFLDSVKSRKPTSTPVEVAHHSAIPGHLGLIAMLVGHKIKWDAKTETIIGDSIASNLLSRPYRDPYKLV